MTRRNYSSNSMILFIKNIKINDNKISLLTKDDIQKLNCIQMNYNNDNTISTIPISKIFDISDSEEELKKDEISSENNFNFEGEIINQKDDIENNEDIDLEDIKNIDNNDLKYYIIQNIKEIDLEKLNKEIKEEINQKMLSILVK